MGDDRAWLTTRERVASFGLLAGYGVALSIGLAYVDETDPDWQRWSVAGATIALALGSVGLVLRAGRRSQELERLVFSESTSLAFVVTMLAGLTYGLLESLVDAPRLSAWWVWFVGMGTWGVAAAAKRRSLR